MVKVTPEVLHDIADAMKKYPDTWWKGFGYVPPYPPECGISNFKDEDHVWRALEVGYEIRRLPRTISINVSVPEPMLGMPKCGESYWHLAPATKEGYRSLTWGNHQVDHDLFQNGIWATESEVKKVAEAFFGSLKG